MDSKGTKSEEGRAEVGRGESIWESLSIQRQLNYCSMQ